VDEGGEAVTLKSNTRSPFQLSADILQKDPHQWSERPCATCTVISGLLGDNFGCLRYAEGLRKQRLARAQPPTGSIGDLRANLSELLFAAKRVVNAARYHEQHMNDISFDALKSETYHLESAVNACKEKP
jgi:hypothetical protein